MKLHIGTLDGTGRQGGSGLQWPLDAVTETFGIFGQRGSGKTTTARVFVEELTKAGQQCVIVDPLGVWWGLKAAANGVDVGFPFTIIGGLHADVPVNDRAGSLIADLVIETTAPLVIDLSGMRKAEGRRFMTAFIDQLWHRATGAKTIHVVVDECDLYIPQRPIKGAETLVGGMEDLVRRGRNRGLGSTMISQRPASVHTDIRSQVSVLIAHRLVGAHDRGALDDWVEAHGTKERRAQMMATLASLDTGEAWMWSPSFLDLFAVVQVRRPITFDSSATPKAGEKRIEPKHLAKADIAALTAKMGSIIEEAEQNDPKALKARIRNMEAEIGKLTNSTEVQIVTETVEVEVEVIPQAILNAWTALIDGLDGVLAGFGQALAGVAAARSTARVERPKPSPAPSRPPAAARSTARQPGASPRQPGAPEPESSQKHMSNIELPKAEKTLLNILAQFPAGRNRKQLSFLSGYSYRASSYRGAMAGLRARGYVNTGEPIMATEAGIAAIDVEALPSGPALLEHWRNELPKASVVLLDLILGAWPGELTKDELGDKSGYSPGASSFRGGMATLRKMDLVEGFAVHPDFAEAIEL